MVTANRRTLIHIVAAAAFAAALPTLLMAVDFLGHRIPQADRVNDYLIGVAAATLIAFLLVGWPLQREDKSALLSLWGIKSLVTLVAMLFYEWNYGLDAYWYFERSQLKFPDFHGLGIGEGTENLVAGLWYLEHSLLPLGSFHAQKVLFSFVGLAGVYLFFLGLRRQLPNLPTRMLLLIGLCPSVLFWSSTLGKDSVILFGICLFFFGAFSFLASLNPVHLASAAAGLLVTAMIRSWIAPMLMVPFFLGLVIRIPYRLVRWCAVAVTVLGLLAGMQNRMSSIMADSLEIEGHVRELDQISRSWAKGGSAGNLPRFTGVGSMVAFLPIGMFTALFRPLPGEILNPFGILAGLENLAILWLLYLAIRRPASGAWKHQVTWLLGTYVLIWATAYAFVSPQNLGSAVRFRLQVMPMMIALLLWIPAAVRQRLTRRR